jgi:hypothetical protein
MSEDALHVAVAVADNAHVRVHVHVRVDVHVTSMSTGETRGGSLR